MFLDDDSLSGLMGLDESMEKFIYQFVNSFIKWEIIQYFQEHPQLPFKISDLAKSLNRSPEQVKHELQELAGFIANDLGTDTPWHISRFHPTYKLTDRPPTPEQTLTRAREIGLEAGLKYVYTGNVPGNSGENTFCYSCGEMVIERWGFQVGVLRIKDGKCSQCGAVMEGVWR